MGRMTYGLLFGVEMKAPGHLGDEGWYTACARYNNRDGATAHKLAVPYNSHGDDFVGIGFWCAVGGSGKPGVPYLEGFPLDEPGRSSPEHAAAIENARKAWAEFVAWASVPQKGGSGRFAWTMPAMTFPEPRLYLVETEVA